jgi:O-antigen ligase
VLQLIGSLLMGLLIAGYLRWNKDDGAAAGGALKRLSKAGVILPVLSFGLICLALLLSGTRASQLGLMASAIAMVIAAGNRRLVIALIAVAVPAAAIGYMTLQTTRYEDGSNQYRQIVWRDGLRLATERPSHLVVGIGMDSIKKHWREWDLFDGGRLEIGHFHSTPVQLAVERGLPALALWFTFLGLYAFRLWKYLRSGGGRRGFGIVLGCFGGLAGFVTAGMVHYNLGDGEVAMIFYLLAGMALSVIERPDAPEQPV